MPIRAVLLLLLLVPGLVRAATLVVAVAGDVRLDGTPLAELVLLQPGAQLRLASGANVLLAEPDQGRQTRWQGPALLRLEAQGARRVGEGPPPERRPLPQALRPALLRTPDNLERIARLDADLPSRLISARLKAARQQYQRWRGQSAADDVTPELYLLDLQLAARDGLGLQATLAEMARRRPDNRRIAQLSAHLVSLDLAMSPGDAGAQVEIKPIQTP
ncbi:hypothetical protein N8I74_07800 [Chitiniphilus purpureus]|uniref:DUF4369 domain-containing protein n=1 Tax=Chitiniphilus purpureus TaxID=2981137 RepID=A0ABY6DSB3_9NEIS|nr:hypothetical protein [Chitiniphilus sp. CD1]UXY16907.1 hypothetical protein N8I74_07800 [Chitiniphilus sp. CD1]